MTMLSDAEKDERLANPSSPNHVTLDDVKAKVVGERFIHDGVLTIAVLTMQNGYVVTGVSACIDPANYDAELGEKIAYDHALKKAWPWEGYLLIERLYQEKAK